MQFSPNIIQNKNDVDKDNVRNSHFLLIEKARGNIVVAGRKVKSWATDR